MNSDNPLRVTSSTDLVATMPYLLRGEPPVTGLVLLSLKGRRVQSIAKRDVSSVETETALSSAEITVNWISATGCDGLMIVAYGTGDMVTAHVEAIINAASTRQMTVFEALRVHDGRCWSYLCHEPECCPPQGREIDPDQSTGPAEAVVRGLVPHGGTSLSTTERIARSRRTLAPDTSLSPEAVAAATRAAETDTGDGTALVLGAIDAERDNSGPQGLDELVCLAVRLRDLRVRDAAWRNITPQTARAHLDLWSRVTRSVMSADRAAPAALTAAAAWVDEDLPLALAALDVAVEAVPDYPMARLILRALEAGMPAHKWTTFVREHLQE